jgi:hypothetical protein
MKMSRKSSITIGSNIFIDLKKKEEEIEEELIKQMKLDFIWLGVVGRLGTDVDKFTRVMVEEEEFSPEAVGFRDSFFMSVNEMLYKKNVLTHEPNLTRTTI